MQKLLIVILAVVGMVMWCGTVQGDDCADCCEPFIRGDIYEDGEITSTDLEWLYWYIMYECVPEEDRFDINDDGEVSQDNEDWEDYDYFEDWFLSSGDPPPEPFDGEGYDWTPDSMGTDCDVAPTDATQGFKGPCYLVKTAGDSWTYAGCASSWGGYGNGMVQSAWHKPCVTKDECTDDYYWERWSRVQMDTETGTGHDPKNEFTIKQLCGRKSSGQGVIQARWYVTGVSQIEWGTGSGYMCESCYPSDYNHTTSDWSNVTLQYAFRPVYGEHMHYSYYVDEVNLHETSKWISQRYNPYCENYNPSNQHIPGTGVPTLDMADVADEFCHVYSLDESTKIVLDHIYIHDWITIWDDHDTGHDLVKAWILNMTFTNYGVDYAVGEEPWQTTP